jgi:2-hydroxychromene-2-carboxylate isomerase
MTKTVTFCYDFGSPYSYLAHRNLKAITETGAEIDFKPVLVGGILNLQTIVHLYQYQKNLHIWLQI